MKTDFAIAKMETFILLTLSIMAFAYGKNGYEMKMGREFGKFSWKNCNTTAAPIAFSALSISPDPVQFGQNIFISFSVDVLRDIGTTNTLQADATVTLYMQGVPIDACDYYPSYCHVQDICKLLSQYQTKCPDFIKKLGTDCKCPFKTKTYSAKNAVYPLPSTPFSIDGELEAVIKLKESNRDLGCLEIHLCIGSC